VTWRRRNKRPCSIGHESMILLWHGSSPSSILLCMRETCGFNLSCFEWVKECRVNYIIKKGFRFSSVVGVSSYHRMMRNLLRIWWRRMERSYIGCTCTVWIWYIWCGWLVGCVRHSWCRSIVLGVKWRLDTTGWDWIWFWNKAICNGREIRWRSISLLGIQSTEKRDIGE